MIDLKNKKILLTGGDGFFGSYVVEELLGHGVDRGRIFVHRRSDFDLRRLSDCQKVVESQDVIIHLAASVGGIGYNREHPAELFYDNLIMGAQLMESARLANVAKFVTIGTIVVATMHYDRSDPVNIGSGIEILISNLANIIKETVGFEGEIIWDAYKPDGQPRRCLDVSRAKELFNFESNISFNNGIRETVEWYLANTKHL